MGLELRDPKGRNTQALNSNFRGTHFSLVCSDMGFVLDKLFSLPWEGPGNPLAAQRLRYGDFIKSHGAYIGLGFIQRTHFHPKGTLLPKANWSRACLPYGAARSSREEGCGELPQFHLCNFFSKVRRSRGRGKREAPFAGIVLLPCWKAQMLRMETHHTCDFQEIIWATASHCA